MDLRQITPEFYVSPQIEPADAPALAAAGINRVICNRPDNEVPPALHAEAVGAALAAHGIAFEVLPVTHQGMTLDLVARQGELAAGPGKTLAYCASGTRSAAAWALSQAGKRPASEILADTARAGYRLDGLRGQIEALAGRG